MVFRDRLLPRRRADAEGVACSNLQQVLPERCFDGVYREKIFETWVSAKVQGPKFFPGDTRENRLFFEHFFVVDLAAAEGR